MNWTEEPSGMGWSYHKSGNFVIEPEDLDFDHWLLWQDKTLVKEGGLEELKTHAATLQ